jgi:hypothetical protein
VNAMDSTPGLLGSEQDQGDSGVPDASGRASVLRELEAILRSPFFQTSKRCQQFLSYVVQHKLGGNNDRLKERTIGVDLFQRPVGYSTGDDPVVRVQAGEVRRRLEQYYHATSNHSPVRIELHVGSYSPEFRWAQDPLPSLEPHETPAGLRQQDALQDAVPSEEQLGVAQPSLKKTEHAVEKRKPFAWILPLSGLVLTAILVLVGTVVYRGRVSKSPPESTLEQFWSPALDSSEPILICLAKPAVYRPTAKLFLKHSKTPDKIGGMSERLMQEPDLQPNDKIVWGDMVEIPDFGIATGDVHAAVQLSGLFGKIGKRNQLRIGGNYSFEDLRNSPAIVIGAFNNRWTMQMTSNLHFAFVEEGEHGFIREDGALGRTWFAKSDSKGKTTEDYAVVTRLLNSKSGQFVVAVGGLLSYGTQAAGELVSSPEYLENALRSAPPDWRQRNLQIVVHTTVTDGISGPPQVAAIYLW